MEEYTQNNQNVVGASRWLAHSCHRLLVSFRMTNLDSLSFMFSELMLPLE